MSAHEHEGIGLPDRAAECRKYVESVGVHRARAEVEQYLREDMGYDKPIKYGSVCGYPACFLSSKVNTKRFPVPGIVAGHLIVNDVA